MVPARDARWRTRLIVAVLLVAHLALAFGAVTTKSVTYDEVYHVTGGYLFDRHADFRVHTDNGVFPQRLHGLAPLLAGAQPPPMDDVYWRVSDSGVIAHHFFYGVGNDHWPWLLGARALNLLFSAGVCLLVFVGARHLAGERAGLIALGLAAFSPSLLAHGPLATTDAAAALLLPAAAVAFWRQLVAPSLGTTAGSVVLFGLACVSKYSAVLLLPAFLVLSLIHARDHHDPRALARSAGSAIAHGAGAVFIIWLCFGFRYAAAAPDLPAAEHLIRPWPWLLERLGWQAPFIETARSWRLLPEGFLFGYANTVVGAQARAAFLASEHSTTGWWQFFPLAFVWKSTPAELLGGVLAGVAAVRALWLRAWRAEWAPLLVFAALYGGAALTSHLNIGHRHLLPLYPVLFVAAAAVLARLPRLRLVAAAALVSSQALSAALAYPHYLAYFNRPSGGPELAWRKLVDSSLDWGQDLPALKTWLDTHRVGSDEPVFLSYFGSGDPGYYGIRATRLPFVNGFKIRHRRAELRPGIYALSATMLQLVYSPFARESAEHESVYRTLAARTASLTDDEWQVFDELRLARLCRTLRARAPDAHAGHSILIYRVNADELARAIGP
jgi:hypothetical protein